MPDHAGDTALGAGWAKEADGMVMWLKPTAALWIKLPHSNAHRPGSRVTHFT
jgi:hypothetical protein